ncbi:hypothetical protein EV182_002979 [Spiromyces aspiralis]|uniref:Uncharacterized protein n=1 Tax=Spiromyces aspiralis TaxID=68401 RepID=A0ACC1HJW1_9FUNG|nr:hypothetical protein EV182_002979 [Spiromyces aspiralis]
MPDLTNPPILSPFGHATSGAASSVLALLLIYPLDTSRLLTEVRSILTKEGIAGFYAGLGPNLLNQLLSGFCYFFCSSLLRSRYRKLRRLPPSTLLSTSAELSLSALAGMLCQALTLPVSVIATRMQTDDLDERRSLSGTVCQILAEDGLAGLWRGFRPSMALCINPAITYGVFERLKSTILAASGGRQRSLSSTQAFVIAALSKSLATVVTYPYIMAKVRLQWRPSKKLLSDHGDAVVYRSTIEVLKKTWGLQGFSGLYQGMRVQIVKAVITQALLLMFKECFNLYIALLFHAIQKSTSRTSRLPKRS